MFPILRTFKRDLEAAGIALKDDEDRRVDFHALRHTFITSLALHGVHPRIAQALARHAKLETTMETYTHLRVVDLEGAVEHSSSAAAEVLGPMLGPSSDVTTQNGASRRTQESDDDDEDDAADPPTVSL